VTVFARKGHGHGADEVVSLVTLTRGIFLIATNVLSLLSRALHTTPYAPVPTTDIGVYLECNENATQDVGN
jgi:hypothetical protein